MDLRVSVRRRDSALANPSRLKRLLRQKGIVEVAMLASEQRKMQSEEFKALVQEWPVERISALVERCAFPKARVCALLSIGQSAFASLCAGRFTPGPALCRRMDQLEQMADRGELHGTYVPDTADLQRKITLFRAWFFEKTPTVEFPLVTVAIRVKWSRSKYHEVVLPIESLPALRLTKWEGLVQVVRAVTVAVRSLAKGNARLLWKDIDSTFWHHYARETLPAIVEERAKAGERFRR